MEGISSEEVLAASRQMIYVLLQHCPGEQCAGCAEVLRPQYEKIIALDQQRVRLVEQMQHQQLTSEPLALFARQMKDLALLPQQLCGDCRSRINQHLLQVELFDAYVLIRPNHPFHLPAHVITAMTKGNRVQK